MGRKGRSGHTGPIRPRSIIPNERTQSVLNKEESEKSPYLNAILKTIKTAPGL